MRAMLVQRGSINAPEKLNVSSIGTWELDEDRVAVLVRIIVIYTGTYVPGKRADVDKAIARHASKCSVARSLAGARLQLVHEAQLTEEAAEGEVIT